MYINYNHFTYWVPQAIGQVSTSPYYILGQPHMVDMEAQKSAQTVQLDLLMGTLTQLGNEWWALHKG